MLLSQPFVCFLLDRKAQAPNAFVESIVAQYKDAPLGQGKAQCKYKFEFSGIPQGPITTSKPPAVTAWS